MSVSLGISLLVVLVVIIVSNYHSAKYTGPRKVERKERWEAVHSCVKCKKELTDNQKIDSDGVCPYCGNTTAGTIVDTVKTSRLVKGWGATNGINGSEK